MNRLRSARPTRRPSGTLNGSPTRRRVVEGAATFRVRTSAMAGPQATAAPRTEATGARRTRGRTCVNALAVSGNEWRKKDASVRRAGHEPWTAGNRTVTCRGRQGRRELHSDEAEVSRALTLPHLHNSPARLARQSAPATSPFSSSAVSAARRVTQLISRAWATFLPRSMLRRRSRSKAVPRDVAA